MPLRLKKGPKLLHPVVLTPTTDSTNSDSSNVEPRKIRKPKDDTIDQESSILDSQSSMESRPDAVPVESNVYHLGGASEKYLTQNIFEHRTVVDRMNLLSRVNEEIKKKMVNNETRDLDVLKTFLLTEENKKRKTLYKVLSRSGVLEKFHQNEIKSKFGQLITDYEEEMININKMPFYDRPTKNLDLKGKLLDLKYDIVKHQEINADDKEQFIGEIDEMLDKLANPTNIYGMDLGQANRQCESVFSSILFKLTKMMFVRSTVNMAKLKEYEASRCKGCSDVCNMQTMRELAKEEAKKMGIAGGRGRGKRRGRQDDDSFEYAIDDFSLNEFSGKFSVDLEMNNANTADSASLSTCDSMCSLF